MSDVDKERRGRIGGLIAVCAVCVAGLFWFLLIEWRADRAMLGSRGACACEQRYECVMRERP